MTKVTKTIAMLLALTLGVVGTIIGAQQMRMWQSLSQNNRAYYSLLLLFGLVLLGEGMFAARLHRYSGLHLMAIAGTALVLAGVQFVGLATNSILCFTPT